MARWLVVDGSQQRLPDGAKSIAVVVAHPDDEVLWAGGLILSNPDCDWFVLSLCRRSDPDRAPKFRRVLDELGATGAIGDLDDGPEQAPLPPRHVEDALRTLWPSAPVDLILTHGPRGEYTRHRRHEELCRAVVALWRSGALRAPELWMFAYDDGGRAYLPRADRTAPIQFNPTADVWTKKRRLVTDTYGFAPESWEARVTPCEEAFWRFLSPDAAADFIETRKPQV